jgi:hypothetical protein
VDTGKHTQLFCVDFLKARSLELPEPSERRNAPLHERRPNDAIVGGAKQFFFINKN